MEDALRNVPGITFQSGEGGMQGDAPFIRGFQARTDIFRDGIRDPGWYTRDIFSSDSVEVFKGPSAFAFGRGSTGGAINITSKQATGAKFFEGTLSGSTPKGVRADIDASGSYANIDARIAAVYQDIDTAGRDNVWTKRWGVAPSMTYKFNEQSRLKLGYIYQGEESVPDYGHPYLPQAVRSPVTGQLTSGGYYGTGQTTGPVPINRNNWFGTTSGPFADRTWTETNILTGRWEYDLTKDLKFANTIALFHGRSLVDADRAALARPRQQRRLSDGVSAGLLQLPGRCDDDRSAAFLERDRQQPVREPDAKSPARSIPVPFTHTVVLGMEYDNEKRWQQRAYGRNSNGSIGTNLCDPIDACLPHQSRLSVRHGYGGEFLGWAPTQTTNAQTVAWYASDSIKLNQYFDFLMGVRNDTFKVDFADQSQPVPGNWNISTAKTTC